MTSTSLIGAARSSARSLIADEYCAIVNLVAPPVTRMPKLARQRGVDAAAHSDVAGAVRNLDCAALADTRQQLALAVWQRHVYVLPQLGEQVGQACPKLVHAVTRLRRDQHRPRYRGRHAVAVEGGRLDQVGLVVNEQARLLSDAEVGEHLLD